MSNANLESTLAERKSRYGTFEGHSALAQQFKRTMKTGPSWPALADDQKECLEMVMHKVARILNGDPNYIDSWHDILGYVTLVEKRLQGEQEPPDPPAPAVLQMPKTTLDGPYTVQSGPYCGEMGCNNLADFRKENGKYMLPFYYCSDCIAERGLDTADMTLMESVA